MTSVDRHLEDGQQGRRARLQHALELVMGELPSSRRGDRNHGVSPPTKIQEREALDEVVRSRIEYQSDDGDWVPAYLLEPISRAATPPVAGRPAALCLHQTTSVGKAEPAGIAGDAGLAYALELSRRGYVTLCPDYPSHGDYLVDAYALGYASTTMKAIVNHLCAVDVLVSMPGVDSSRIGCLGHSLGGHNALFLAPFDERVSAFVVSCGFTSFCRYNGGDISPWALPKYMPRVATIYGNRPRLLPFDFSHILSVLGSRPAFVNAPAHDENFDVEGVRRSVLAARRLRRDAGEGDGVIDLVVPACGHAFPPDVRRKAYGFLDHHLLAGEAPTWSGSVSSRGVDS